MNTLFGSSLGGWPPQDDELTVALPDDAWRFVIQELHRWEQVMSDDGAAPDAAGEPGLGVPESPGLRVARTLAERLDGAG